MRRYSLLIPLLLSLLLCSCQSRPADPSDTDLPVLTEMLSSSAFVLDTFVSIRLYDRGDEALIQECFDLCRYYEDLFSRTIDTSDIGRIIFAFAALLFRPGSLPRNRPTAKALSYIFSKKPFI